VAALAVGLVLPAIVAVFTKPSTNPTVKGFAHAVLAVATGSLATYKADPSNFVWAPAVIAAFLAWLSGTAFYHSLLKKYSWFGALQNLFVSEVESRLNTHGADVERYFEVAQAAEQAEDAQGITNDFPLSTDVVQSGVEEAVHAAEEIPVVGAVVQHFETVAVPAIVTAVEAVAAPVVENSTPAVAVQPGGLGPRAL
jgi:cytochrome c biogenesis factor